jgi:hypothetical protein
MIGSIKPLIATPCYGSMLCLNYVTSILRLRTAWAQIGMEPEFYFRSESLITRARNDCVAYFLARPRFTHLLWVDADIGFEPAAALRLLMSGHDVAAGVYPLKDDAAGFAADPADAGPIDADGFARIREAPTGFMCIKREVFSRIAEANPQLRYEVPGQPAHYRFFDTMIDPESGRYLSEDYAFCRRWESVGGAVYVDARSKLSHQGTKLYAGDFGSTIRRET